MSLHLYCSYSSKLTEVGILEIDKRVVANRLALNKFVKKVYGKVKVIVITNCIGLFILVSTPKNVNAIGVTVRPQIPIMRQSIEVVPSYARRTIKKEYKIAFIKNKEIDGTSFGLPKNHMTTINNLVKLRGGDISPLTKVILFRFFLIWAMGQGYTTTTGFQPVGLHSSFARSGRACASNRPKASRKSDK